MKTNMDNLDEAMKPRPKKYFFVKRALKYSDRKFYKSAASLGNRSSSLVSSMRGFTTRQDVKKAPINIFELVKQLRQRKSLNISPCLD